MLFMLIPLPLPFLNPFLRYFTRTHMSTIESVECGFVSEVFPFNLIPSSWLKMVRM